jgi:hypothetical protein
VGDRDFRLKTGCAVKVLSHGEADSRGIRSGCVWEGSTAHDEMERASGEGVEKGLKRKMVASFIDVERPVHAPCLKQRVAKPGGQTVVLR